MAVGSVRSGVIQVIADGVNSSPGRIKGTQTLLEVGYKAKAQRRLLATRINHHFWDVRSQAFSPWLSPADTDDGDQLVNDVVSEVGGRHPHSKSDDDKPPR